MVDIFTNRPAVLCSADFVRVNGLPRRVWSDEQAADLSSDMTKVLRTPHGMQDLRPVQAVALFESFTHEHSTPQGTCKGGFFGALGVGAGKTLYFMLLATLFGVERYGYLVPAKLAKEKTAKEWSEYAKHWRVGPPPTVVSYELLARVQSKTLLTDLGLQLVGADECHKLKNPSAAVTRRVRHWRQAHQTVPLCVGSGSITKRSIRDYAHLAAWTLGQGAPVPLNHDTLEEWCYALDGGTNFANRIEPGALLAWAEGSDTASARKGFQRRLAETPGCMVYHVAQDDIGATVNIRAEVLEAPAEMAPAWEALRGWTDKDGTEHGGWELIDGTELVEGCEVYRHARELALGFYYKWRHPGPEPWMVARKAWGQFARENLKGSRFDSPDETAKAYPTAPEWTAWRDIRSTFEPETTIVWLSAHALHLCAEWLKDGGVAFVEHSQFGQALAYTAKVPFFGAQGLDGNGRSIEHFQGKACVASLGSNSEGRNLQRFCRMLITSPVPNNLQLEQLIGRMHREGQEADSVDVTVLFGCYEGAGAFWQSVYDARSDTVHNVHKVLDARLEVPEMWELPKTPAFVK